jgi:hypothetical protein
MVRGVAMAMVDCGATETAAAMVDGNRNGNGRGRRQWAMAMAMATELVTATEMATAVAIDGHGEGDNDKWRVASSCAGNVQRGCGRGDTLPPPPWTQRKVHSPALHHGGETAKSVCSLSRGGVPDSSPWILFLFILFTTTVQFTEQPSVRPPHYSGAQEPCQPIDALPPPVLQEPRQPIDNLPRLLLHFLSR